MHILVSRVKYDLQLQYSYLLLYDPPYPFDVPNGILITMVMLQIFHKRMPPEAIDLVSRLLQYSPNLRCSAVSFSISSSRFKVC